MKSHEDVFMVCDRENKATLGISPIFLLKNEQFQFQNVAVHFQMIGFVKWMRRWMYRHMFASAGRVQFKSWN